MNDYRELAGIERWMGYVAVLVAVIAAGAAIYEARINREFQAISVWPYVQMWAGVNRANDSNLPPFSFNIANKGVGPAIVESVKIRYRGQPMRDWIEWLETVASESGEVEARALVRTLSQADLEPGEVIEPSEIRQVITIAHPVGGVVLGPAAYGDTEVEICYCSLYRECWSLTFPKARPERQEWCVSPQ